jgi:hypothetical protein
MMKGGIIDGTSKPPQQLLGRATSSLAAIAWFGQQRSSSSEVWSSPDGSNHDCSACGPFFGVALFKTENQRLDAGNFRTAVLQDFVMLGPTFLLPSRFSSDRIPTELNLNQRLFTKAIASPQLPYVHLTGSFFSGGLHWAPSSSVLSPTVSVRQTKPMTCTLRYLPRRDVVRLRLVDGKCRADSKTVNPSARICFCFFGVYLLCLTLRNGES